MKSRKLRFAWTVVCAIACVLLIVLWVQSNQQPYFRRLVGHRFLAFKGEIQIDKRSVTLEVPTGRWHTGPGDGVETLWKTREVQIQPDTGITLPFWLPAIAILALAAAPWFRWRFSLRTLLIATTLIAVVLGMLAYATRQ